MPPGPRQAGGSGNGGGYGASASTSSGSSTSTNGTSTTSTTSTKTTGTSTSTAVPAPLNPHKRRRLQFTSELPVTIPRWNPDGTETQEWLRYQSNLRLKSKWDSICQKFSNAHLLPQDEIHLGDERKGEEMRVIKDRGILRQVTEPIEFGMFHIRDQDLKHVRIVGGRPKDKRSVKGTDGDSSSEDELAEWTHTVQFSRIARPPTAAPSNRNRIAVTANGHDDAGSQDAQLAEFLEAEARRRALVDQHSLDSGEDERDEEDEDDDEDEVYDFADPNWDKGLASPLDDPEPIPSSNRDPSPTSSADEFDIISAMSDPEEDAFDRWASDKRQNVEDVLTAPEPFASIPFGDMDGLAECIERHLAEQAPPESVPPALTALDDPLEMDSYPLMPSSSPRAQPTRATSASSLDMQTTPSSQRRKKQQTPRRQTPAPLQKAAATPRASIAAATSRPDSASTPTPTPTPIPTPTPTPTPTKLTPSRRSRKKTVTAAATPLAADLNDDNGDGDDDGFFGFGGCLGPGRCTKSFCMQCGSVSAASRHRKQKRPRDDDPETPSKSAGMEAGEPQRARSQIPLRGQEGRGRQKHPPD
ncbi:uncharacterized protein PSFLO_01719 [Pseudozyma flocculosa]|uniref:Uncharacterized protein n=1 Tax=Pseudozyma flocculosa TaxID=84751 RepID=A0A5C3EVI0_9BASI|nr:uncharacterized protein PSFLO_01719 [Pseudozyma flocculosa]